jgi:hypothetical protein
MILDDHVFWLEYVSYPIDTICRNNYIDAIFNVGLFVATGESMLGIESIKYLRDIYFYNGINIEVSGLHWSLDTKRTMNDYTVNRILQTCTKTKELWEEYNEALSCYKQRQSMFGSFS